jgi:hypothetical protein
MLPPTRKAKPLTQRRGLWLGAVAAVFAIAGVGYAALPRMSPSAPPALGMMPDRWFDRPERADWTGWDAARPTPGPRVRIAVAAARVQVIPEARADVAVEVRPAAAAAPIKVSRQGLDLIVDDGAVPQHKPLFGRAPSPCQDGRVTTADGPKPPAALPLIVLRTPRRVDLHATGALFGDIGPADSVLLVNTGCGSWTVADAETLRLAQVGEGRIGAGQARTLIARVDGPGGVDARRVLQKLDVFLLGPGRVHVGRADGRLDAEIWGAGRLEVDQGRAGRANLFKHGAGEIVLKGEAATLNAETFGKGSIRIGVVSGSAGVSTHGDGEVLYERKEGKAYCRGRDCI